MTRKRQSPSSDKALHGPPEDKTLPGQRGALKVSTISSDQDVLERNANIGSGPPSDHKTVTCYNPACADYRRPRSDGSSCACKKTTIDAT